MRFRFVFCLVSSVVVSCTSAQESNAGTMAPSTSLDDTTSAAPARSSAALSTLDPVANGNSVPPITPPPSTTSSTPTTTPETTFRNTLVGSSDASGTPALSPEPTFRTVLDDTPTPSPSPSPEPTFQDTLGASSTLSPGRGSAPVDAAPVSTPASSNASPENSPTPNPQDRFSKSIGTSAPPPAPTSAEGTRSPAPDTSSSTLVPEPSQSPASSDESPELTPNSNAGPESSSSSASNGPTNEPVDASVSPLSPLASEVTSPEFRSSGSVNSNAASRADAPPSGAVSDSGLDHDSSAARVFADVDSSLGGSNSVSNSAGSIGEYGSVEFDAASGDSVPGADKEADPPSTDMSRDKSSSSTGTRSFGAGHCVLSLTLASVIAAIG